MIGFKEIENLYDEINRNHEVINEKISLELNEQLDQLINGNGFKRQNIFDLIEKFRIQYVYTQRIKYKNISCILSYLYFYRNAKDEYNLDLKNIKTAMTLILPYIQEYYHLSNENNDEYIHFIKSIKSFKKKGYQINMKNGEIKCDQAIKYIAQKLESKIQSLGINFITNLFKIIPKINEIFYQFPDSSKSLITPWGYLCNLGVKHTEKSKINNKDKEIVIFNNILNMSKEFVSLYKIQNFGLKEQIELSYTDGIGLVDLIQKQIYRDQTFKIEQYNPSSIYSFISFINDKYKDKTIEAIHMFFKEINKKKLDIFIDINEVCEALKSKYDTTTLKEVVERLTSKSPNYKFLTLNDYSKKDYSLKPFLYHNSNPIYINHNFFCVGFYHSVMKRLNEIGFNDSKLGYILEEFVDFSLSNQNVNLILGEKKYNITPEQREELNISSLELESDGIFYDEDNIFFMELKKRPLNQNSIGGDVYSTLADLSISLIHSQTQANKHLRYLKKYNRIDFTSGSKIELNERHISKLSVCSLDYGGLHSLQYVQQILLLFTTILLNNNPQFESSITLINKKLENYTKEIMQSVSDGIMENNPQGYMNCFFVNIFQLLELVEISKNNNTNLIKEINSVRQLRLNQSDFYMIDNFMREIKEQKTSVT